MAVDNFAVLLKLAGAGAAVLLTAFWIGRLTLNRLPDVQGDLFDDEERLFALGLGAAALSTAIFCLGLLGLLQDVAFVALLVGSGGAWARWGRRRATPAPREERPSEPVWLKRAGAVVVAAYLPLYLVHAFAPETGWDAVGYHLGLVGRYYHAHRVFPIETNFYAFLSQGAEMLYVFAYALGRVDAPKLVHFGFFLAVAVAIRAFGRRVGRPSAGLAAALLWFCASVAATEAVRAYVDCVSAFIQFLLFYGLTLWLPRPSPQRLGALGVLAGFAFAVKYTGAFAAAAAGLVVVAALARRFGPGRRAWRMFAPFAVLAAVFALGWPARNFAISGNPVAPFYNRIFPNPYLTIEWEDFYRDYFRHYAYEGERRGLQDRLEIPLELTVRGAKLGGLLGPVFLLAPLALLALRVREGRWLLAATAVAWIPWFSNIGTRFLIPVLPFLALAMTLGVGALPGRRPAAWAGALALLHALSSWPAVITMWQPRLGVDRIHDWPWKAALRLKPDYEYRGEKVIGFGPVFALRALASPGDRVFSLGSLPEAFFDGEIIVGFQSALGADLRRDMQTAIDADLRPTRSLRFAWEPASRSTGFRLEQTATKPDHWWEVAEITLYAGSAPIAPRPRWTVVAEFAPWTAHRLIDGDPWTVWRTWRPLEPTRVEILTPDGVVADGLEIRAPQGQHYAEYRCFRRDVEGNWSEFSPREELTRAEIKPFAARARANRSLRENDVRFVVVEAPSEGGDAIALDIGRDPAAWGFKEIWRERDWRVYRVLGAEAIPSH